VLDPLGRGLRNAVVSLVNSQNAVQSVPTSSLGYFSFENVQVGQSYELRAVSRRFKFENRQLTVTDNLSVDLFGLE
jgi:hypothetical protein